MDTTEVSIKQSNGLLRGLMNNKLQRELQQVLPEEAWKPFLSKEITEFSNLGQLSIKEADDKVLQPGTNKYLAKKAPSQNKGNDGTMSSVIPQMGGSLFENLRIYRDIIYTKQSREQRLLSCLKAQMYKAKANANKERGTAYI